MTTDSATTFQGAIFDVDGVLVDSPHEKAWREALRELMEGDWSDIRGRTTWSPDGFTSRVYEEQLSGKPRMAGARAAFEYFHIPDDEEEHRLLEYAERKQAMVIQLIEAGDFTAYPDALRFIIAVKGAGLRVAAASSSKNAELFLRQIRLDTFARSRASRQRRSARVYAARLLRRRRLRAGLRARKARPGDVPHRGARARRRARGRNRDGRRRRRSAGGQSRPDGRDRYLSQGRRRAVGRRGADIVVKTLDEVDMAALADGRLAIAAAR